MLIKSSKPFKRLRMESRIGTLVGKLLALLILSLLSIPSFGQNRDSLRARKMRELLEIDRIIMDSLRQEFERQPKLFRIQLAINGNQRRLERNCEFFAMVNGTKVIPTKVGENKFLFPAQQDHIQFVLRYKRKLEIKSPSIPGKMVQKGAKVEFGQILKMKRVEKLKRKHFEEYEAWIPYSELLELESLRQDEREGKAIKFTVIYPRTFGNGIFIRSCYTDDR